MEIIKIQHIKLANLYCVVGSPTKTHRVKLGRDEINGSDLHIDRLKESVCIETARPLKDQMAEQMIKLMIK